MLPAHYYPAFKKYDNFYGNYGNAWWKQREEFESFNGPILMTTNCVVLPKESYKNRLFTTGASGVAGCPHIERDENGHKDFSQIIELAKTCQPPVEIEKGEIIGGFAHNQVFALADKVVDAVKSEQSEILCYGRLMVVRNLETLYRIYKSFTKDAVILTAGCAKYKYKSDLAISVVSLEFLDAGQYQTPTLSSNRA